MSYSVMISEEALKQLKKLDVQQRAFIMSYIRKKLDGIENPRQTGKALTGEFKGLWRYRIGNYRIVCDIQDYRVVIVVIAIGNRKNIYD